MVNNKHVFWQALILAVVVFWTGILIGMMIEGARTDKLEKYYLDSETNMFDINLQDNLLTTLNFSCDYINNKSIIFADQIYFESKALEKYDSSSQITEDVLRLHRRYDFLRTLLWSSLIDRSDKCKNMSNVVVYLYQYNDPNIETGAKQTTFSNLLFDLKNKYGEKVILIPIAYDSNVQSLNILMKKYGLENEPTIFINQKFKITNISSINDVERYLR